MALLEQIPAALPDNTFVLIEAFKVDTEKKKVNLSPGIYRDDNAKTWVLPSVKKAREVLQADPHLNHDISPQMGYPDLVSVARQITFGDTLGSRSITSMQTIAGTGANYMIARFLTYVAQPKTVWLSNPTWENHPKIWRHTNPAIEQRLYPYYDYKTSTLDIKGMISTLKEQASRGDVIVLQACAHNPTGLDPSREQWESIANVCEEKGLFPILDSAYQGFATGDIDNDGWVLRHFATRSNGAIEFAVAQSFSKNFGLYGERIGALHVVARNQETAAKVEATLKQISRAEITSTPGFGAKVVATIVQNPELRKQWQQDLNTMSGRLRDMRKRLHDELTKRETPGNWRHLLTDIGMFSITGLSQEQVTTLKDSFHVYLLPTGRLSFTGLTTGNVEYVAESIHRVLTL
ncbi:aspartate aminotransferase [Trichoderma harzianum]|uniref:Aspartate aminotransferase n=1 Tax=Trichoderma harzianum TaxID=5544 RepID=A0A0F9X2T1_TRIHA|nr:aspartate aminotransferase [Trichoderma harzianum]